MKFIRLHLRAFGKFTNRAIELADGLNIIYGENEAGKSTVHAFLRGMLYGFKKPATTKRYFTAEQERFRPWQGQAYAGVLEYAAGGRRYLIQRDFARDDTAVFDALTGAEITGCFRPDKRREYDFAVQHTGLSGTAFDNTVSVRQLGIAPAEELAAEVAGRLANLSSAGAEDISVQNALARLQKAAEQIGTARAEAKPHGRAVARAAALAEELHRSEAVLTGLRELENRLAACRRAIAAKERALAEAAAALDNANHIRLRERLAKAREYYARRQEIETACSELARYADFPLEHEEAVKRLVQAQREEEAVRREVGREIAQLTERRQELAQSLAGQAAYAALGNDDLLTVSSGFARCRDLAEAVAAYGQELTALQAELAATAAALASYQAFGAGYAAAAPKVAELDGNISRLEQALVRLQTARRAPAGWLAAAGLVVAAAGFAGYRLDNPWLVFAGAVLAAVLLYWRGIFSGRGRGEVSSTERELAHDRAELAAVLQASGVESGREFWEKAARYDALRQKKEMQEARIAAVEQSRNRAEQKAAELRALICARLAGAGLWQEGRELTEDLVRQFNAALQASSELRREKAAVEEQLAARREAAEKMDKKMAELAAELAKILAGTRAADAAEFLAGCGRRRAYEALREQLADQTNLLDAVLQGKDLAALEAEAALYPAAVLPGAVTAETVDDLTAAAERYRSELASLERERVELEATIETQTKGLRSPAEIAEELTAVNKTIAGYETDLQAIEMARELISELSRTIHREFAPRLNRRVGEIIGTITGGRYRDVRITENIDVSTASPETGALVQITGLSAGTADQFYLAARLAIAEVLTDNPALPLILDDCFVHYDEYRLRNVLAFLAELAGTHQILLFTCRRREAELLREMEVPFNYISL